ncbi:MAG: hypothetical protein ACE5OY_01025 [Candidatus Bathyarchaeia archaeon]
MLGVAVKGFHYLLALPIGLLFLAMLTPAYSSATLQPHDTSDVEDVIQKVTSVIETFLQVVANSAMNIARLFYVVMAIVGSILWTSRLDRLMGRDLILGAVLLAFVSEFIIPVILH